MATKYGVESWQLAALRAGWRDGCGRIAPSDAPAEALKRARAYGNRHKGLQPIERVRRMESYAEFYLNYYYTAFTENLTAGWERVGPMAWAVACASATLTAARPWPEQYQVHAPDDVDA